MKKRPLIILTGPTAVGKTDLSIQLAKEVNGEIISADSMQVYKNMNIGTAKVTKEEMCGIPHYLIDELMPEDEFNVTVFQKLAKQAAETIYAKGKIPIVAGGTGFYIQALLYDVDFAEDENDYSYRNELEELASEKGAEFLHQMLAGIDTEAAENIHANNVKRVIRALEYYHLTGKKISEHNKEQRKKESAYNFVYFVLTMNRDRLYERIDRRVDQMLENGLLEGIIELPNGSLTFSGIKTYMLIFSKNNKKVKMLDASNVLEESTKRFKKVRLPVEKILELYKEKEVPSKLIDDLKDVNNLSPSIVLMNVEKIENGVRLSDLAEVYTGNQYTLGVFEKNKMLSDETTGYRILTS
ncbi:MAG: tRNA (adenosine(37)-N6)-dimethylallyltransferase MiaA, partial [Lachnospiraceae bacterium]|nr:tRNA (adenosine(37)-N6)-dimethylallyltransferase MiaA [Lachnospiraceae bacterium]